MRLLLDMNMSIELVHWLRAREHDVHHVRERGLQLAPDDVIYALATAERRAIMTYDRGFARLAAYTRSGASVILFRLQSGRPSRVIPHLGDLFERYTDELVRGAIVSVEPGGMRLRLLPIDRPR